MAYVVQFDLAPEEIEKALDSKLHIISVDSASASNRDEALSRLLEDIQKQIDTKAGTALRSSRPDIFEEIKTEISNKQTSLTAQLPLVESTSRLCFVMMPFSDRFNEIYRLLIGPAVEQSGLTVLRADEMAGTGFIVEQIRTAIHQSRLCIADITGLNSNVLWEIGVASSLDKPLILLAESALNLPFNLAHRRVIVYGTDFNSTLSVLRHAISYALSRERLQIAADLLEIKQYRSAIAASAVVLEHTLRQLLERRGTDNSARMSMGQILQKVAHQKLLDQNSISRLREAIIIRNLAVHGMEEPTQDQARFVLSTIRDVLTKLPSTEEQA